jgi:hypothetical protein
VGSRGAALVIARSSGGHHPINMVSPPDSRA